MPEVTAILSLPYLQPSQAQKHVTHNEALRDLDAIVQLAVVNRSLTTPPGSPDAGDRHIVAAGATGDWAGQDNNIAVWEDNIWNFTPPLAGWRAHVLAEARDVIFDTAGGTWLDSDNFRFSATELGVNASADAINRLSVSADATLLNHEGNGHQLKLNKAAAPDTASLMYQTGFSGRAEMGLTGDDDFHVKVSADGSSWTEALVVTPSSGHMTGAAVQASATDATAGKLLTVGAFGLGDAAGVLLSDVDTHYTAGFYYGYGGTHASATLGTNPFPTLNGAFGMLVGNATLGGVDRYLWQIATNISTGELRRRSRGGAGWGDWHIVYDTKNILGTASQTGGTPTGAIIERGANGNGEYARFADGTQICWNALPSSASATSTWTFPAAFVDANARLFGSLRSDAAALVSFAAPSTTAVNFSAWNTSGSRTAYSCSLMAIGRWF